METVHTIKVTKTEKEVIEDVINFLDDFPVDLTNDLYVDILREIANESNRVDELDDVKIEYIED